MLNRAYAGPFEGWGRPEPEECREVTRRLVQLHGQPARTIDPLALHCGGQTTVMDSLMRTLLSQNTTDITSMRAFTALKARFPTWPEVLAAPAAELEDAIRVGGLAAIKAARMQALLQTLLDERGACCLEFLRQEPDDVVKAFLSRFKGVGAKTISCVLLFCLQRPDFAVDTHVWHITQQLGWCPTGCSRDQAYAHLNCMVPDDVKHDLHVLLVSHGKTCASCSKTGRGDKGCPIAELKRPRAGKAKAKAKATTKAPAKLLPAAVVPAKVEVKVEPQRTQAKVKAEPAVVAVEVDTARVKVEPQAEGVKVEEGSTVVVKREAGAAAAPAPARKRGKRGQCM